jgi:GTP pyrophosphokinase
VEVITSDSKTPSRDWLGFVRTSRARSKIRQWIRREEYESAVALGKEILLREWKKLRKRPDESRLLEAARELKLEGGVDGLHAAVGRGDLGLTKVIRTVFPEEEGPARDTAGGAFSKLVDRVRSQKGIRIQGMDNLMVRYSQCCQPVPGDDVIGYITRGRGVSIHRSDCPNVLNLSDRPERRVDIEWDSDGSQRFVVRLVLEGTDRHGLFADIARSISDTGTNIQSADIRAIEGGLRGQFVVEVENLSHLKKVVKHVRRVKGVLSVERRESFVESDLTLEAP